MNTTRKIDLSRPCMVMKKGKVCQKPYHKRKFLYLEKSKLGSAEAFKETLSEEVRFFDDGEYFLRAAQVGKDLNKGGIVVGSFSVADGAIDNSSLR